MHWDDWIELDDEYLQYHSLKAARIAERGEKCCKTAPEAWDAAVELLEELCGYLPERYPTLYQRLEGRRNGVVNLATGETIDINNRLEIDKEDPMQVCARLVQDDLAIMIEVCSPISAYHFLPESIVLIFPAAPRRPIPPPRGRHPARRLLAPRGQIRHAAVRDPHLGRCSAVQRET
jgi:alpha-1,2-mannosyltransferase